MELTDKQWGRIEPVILQERFTPSTECRRNLSATKRYDSDKLDGNFLKKHGVELITPHPGKSQKNQVGRKLRRHKRRWKVERLFAWLQNFRRLVACSIILIRFLR